MKSPVLVLDYGMGNIHSITKALGLFVSELRYSRDEEEISKASALVLPGDGAFAAAMDHLGTGLKESLLNFARSGRPILGICIGFQILFSNSEESFSKERTKQKTKGLDLIAGEIRRFSFSSPSPIPHMGWNQILLEPSSGLPKSLDRKYVYFIHSYYAAGVAEKFVSAYCNYGGQVFPAIVKKENITATQFHPEKSAGAGLEFLKSWTKTI